MTVFARTNKLTSMLPVGLLLSCLAGCSGLTAVKDPAFASALEDPAPMSVVVRRADDAARTADEVNRLLASTPASASSDWLKHVGPNAADVAADLTAAAEEPMYKESHAKVLSAEVWARALPAIKSQKGDKSSLLAILRPDLGDAYASLVGKQAEVTAVAALIAQEKAALADKSLSADDRAEHESTVGKLEKMQADSVAEIAPERKAFVTKATDAATHLSQSDKDKLAPAIANMLQALADADAANKAAGLRYALAVPSTATSVKTVVPSLVADIVEEKTGKRPALDGLTPEVAVQGTQAVVTLGGVTDKDLAPLSVDAVTKEASARASKWLEHAATLPSAVSAHGDALAFQTEVLTDIMGNLVTDPAAASKLAVQIQPVDATPAVDVAGGASAKSALALAADAKVPSKVPGLPSGASGALAMAGKASAMAKDPKGAAMDMAKDGLGAAAAKVPGGSAALALTGGKVPGLPSGGAAALAGAGATAAASKIPGAGSAFAFAGKAASLAKDPKGAAMDLAKDAAGAAAAKVPGGAVALGAASSALAIAKDPKAGARDLAKDAAGAALKKLPVPGAVSGSLGGFLK
jgi:hypothetical protein